MSKLGDALGFATKAAPAEEEGDGMEMSEPPASVDEAAPAGAEVLAMKQFKRASTPEAMAQALKDFLEACGVTGSDAY